MRKAVDAHRSGALFDLHSCNKAHCGLPCPHSSSALIYMAHFAFLDSLWFGEGFSPDYPPAQWLVQMSGIPYGMHAEQLSAPNLWRGMVFAEGARPAPYLWAAWDSMGLTAEGVEIVGWWDSRVPVKVRITSPCHWLILDSHRPPCIAVSALDCSQAGAGLGTADSHNLVHFWVVGQGRRRHYRERLHAAKVRLWLRDCGGQLEQGLRQRQCVSRDRLAGGWAESSRCKPHCSGDPEFPKRYDAICRKPPVICSSCQRLFARPSLEHRQKLCPLAATVKLHL